MNSRPWTFIAPAVLGLALAAGCSNNAPTSPQAISTLPASGVSGTTTPPAPITSAGSTGATSTAPSPTAGNGDAAASGGSPGAANPASTSSAGNAAPSAGASGSTAGNTSPQPSAAGGAGAMAAAGAGDNAAGTSGGSEAAAGMTPDGAGTGAQSADAAGSGAPTGSGTTCLKGSGDFLMNGPYKVKTKQVSIGSKGMYTIYYPDPLETDCPHPIVAWGNGTTITGGTAYAHFHNHAASWGIVTATSHNSNVGDGSFHKAAIDYLLEQNKDSSSEFFGKLSTLAGVSGHSQGGAGSDRAADHPNVKAIVNVQGSFGTPPMSTAALLCLTGTDDIQPTGCPMAVKAATVPAVCASWDGADHVSTTLFQGEGIEQYKRLYSAWFRCFLADDGAACAMFKGGMDCPVCKERGWKEIFANNY